MLRGIGVSPGVAMGPALIVQWDFPEVPDRAVAPDQVEAEVARLHEAVDDVVATLTELGERVLRRAGPEEARIFDAQILMAQDDEFLKGVEVLIRKNQLSAETAYEFKALELRNLWSGAARLRERLADLHAIQLRIINRLLGRSGAELSALPTDEQVIVVAHELSPGPHGAARPGARRRPGERGGHPDGARRHPRPQPRHPGGDGRRRGARQHPVRHDGAARRAERASSSSIPPGTSWRTRKTQVSRRHKLELQLEGVVDQPAVTPEGRPILIMGNVDLPEEIEPALRLGAQGVGLLRTEFLLTGRATLPTEDEQAQYFRRVALAFPDRTVIIRSFDLGGDKFPVAFKAPHEANPFLGWRSIRVCLDEPEVFRPQIRAVLRAAWGRDVQLMLPLVTRVEEVLETQAIVQEEAASLKAAGVRAAETLAVGVMIETPAAVLIADRLAEVSAFFSVGTNDLTQYTMAVDRGNARLADRFTPHHPSIVRQLQRVVEVGRDAGLPVSVCGEMASEALSAVLLIGLGYERLSVSPPALPLVKWVVRTVPEEAARRAAEIALAASSAAEVSARSAAR